MTELFVVLIGRSHAESWLRREPGVELRRARTGLDALGELLYLPKDCHAVFMVPPGAIDERHFGEFVSSARRVEPRARFVSIGAREGAMKLLDASVEEHASPGALRLALEHASSARPARASIPHAAAQAARQLSPETAPERFEFPPLEPSAASGPASQFDADASLIHALMSGADLTGMLLGEFRKRVDASRVRVLLGEHAAAEDGPDRAGEVRLPLLAGDRVLGVVLAPDESSRAIEPAVRWLASWLALKEQHAQLQAAAFTDPLTGAWNRRYFDRFLPLALSRARQSRNSLTLLLFDIDDFKHYNDRYGHGAGDEILIEVVQLLNSVIRPTDRVCRMGGDEFAVIFDEPAGPRDPRSQHPQSIFQIALRFQRQIQEHRFPKLGDEARGSLTISGGMATFPWDAADADSLVQRADELILESKKAGKNAIRIGPSRGSEQPRTTP